MLATRISRLVASRRLTFGVVSTQEIKSKNFAFDFNKKLNPCLVESAHCNRNLVAAMFSANKNHRRRETGTSNFVRKWPGTSNMATCSCVASDGFALVCEKEVASCSVFKLRELCKLHANLMPVYMRV